MFIRPGKRIVLSLHGSVKTIHVEHPGGPEIPWLVPREIKRTA